MPYGRDLIHRVTPNLRENEMSVNGIRWQAIPEIKAELSRFASLRYAYKKSDLRWAHVLCDKDNKIFLCDLESLKGIPRSNNPDDVAWGQLEILVKPIVNEDNLNSCLQWVRTKGEEAYSIVSTRAALNDLMVEDVKGVLDSLRHRQTTVEELSSKDKVCLHAVWFWKMEKEASDLPDSPGLRDSSEPSLKMDRDATMSEVEDETNALQPSSKHFKATEEQALQGNQECKGK